MAFSVVAVVALPLLLPQPKPPPEADKSPGSPKLAIESYLLNGQRSIIKKFGGGRLKPKFPRNHQKKNHYCSPIARVTDHVGSLIKKSKREHGRASREGRLICGLFFFNFPETDQGRDRQVRYD